MKKKKAAKKTKPSDTLPQEPGVYLAKGVWGSTDWKEVDVYSHEVKGLCVFAEDFGSGGTGVDGETDDHVSVQCTGLEFSEKVRDL